MRLYSASISSMVTRVSFLRLSKPFLDTPQPLVIFVELISMVIDALPVLGDEPFSSLHFRHQLDAAEVVRLLVLHHASETNPPHRHEHSLWTTCPQDPPHDVCPRGARGHKVE